MKLAETPEPPYYAVIFTSLQTSDLEGYGETAERMVELASQVPGYLGIESARGEDGLGITVSYWQSLEAIRAWRDQMEHRAAQKQGRLQWYRHFRLRVCRVERDDEFRRQEE